MLSASNAGAWTTGNLVSNRSVGGAHGSQSQRALVLSDACARRPLVVWRRAGRREAASQLATT